MKEAGEDGSVGLNMKTQGRGYAAARSNGGSVRVAIDAR